MAELKRTELSVHQERAFLVAVQLNGRSREHRDHRASLGGAPGGGSRSEPLDELRGLATTAGARVVGALVQKRERPHPGTYLGKGKLEELKTLAHAADADVIVFDNDLSPAQIRNLELATDRKVLDRTELILDIFATHAQTYEARLQVECAQLDYALPRLKRMWTHLSRIEGGIGTRGPGEKQLEEDRRLVEDRLVDLRRRLREVERRRERLVAARRDISTVSLVGYTNAGKSTLMNALTDAGVLVADKLFATLDTRTRRWDVHGWGPVLLSDTVGFIRNLPHHLVTSFKATLAEARQADLLLHVVDASAREAEAQIAAVRQVLEQIGCAHKPTLLVLNKTDAVSDRSYLDVLRSRYADAVPVSARDRTGFDKLQRAVLEKISRGTLEAEVVADAGDGRLFSWLASHTEVLSRHFDDGRARVRCRIAPQRVKQLEAMQVEVRISDGGV